MDVKELLKDLMAFPVLGGESNLTILSYIEQYLQQFDIQVHRVYNEDGTKASMHCRIGPPVSGGYILSGHMDVVPVAGQQWNTDPFVLTEKGDKLYGRGSCDMKGFDASCLAAIPYLVKLDLKKPIYLAFSYDEEIGCLGAPDLVAAINSHYEEKPQYAIIGEPSMMIPTIGQKGICIFETTVNGSAGHSSRIMQEVSAIHEASRLVIWLEGLMKSLVSKGNVDPRFDPPHTSIHCGVFKGGIAPNVISDECTFTWDVRNIPMDSIDDIKQEFDDHCAIRTAELKSVFPDFKIRTVEHHPAVPALDTDASDALVGLLQNLSGNNRTDAVSYAAEAGQFAEGGFTSIICGPGDIAQAHRADEFISIDQLNQGEAMIRNLGDYLSRDK
ncbi:MAG: acetylornithine deacetylase [Cyclobacteriaceae bacterium]|jgi:acetylornithine deacetylase